MYILDDGKDPDKKAWVQKQNDPEMAYTPGHLKSGPEINGKACNLNSTLRALFPAGTDIPLEEVRQHFSETAIVMRHSGAFIAKRLKLWVRQDFSNAAIVKRHSETFIAVPSNCG